MARKDDKYRTRFKEQLKADMKGRGLSREQAIDEYAQTLKQFDERRGQVKGEGALKSIGRGLVQPFAKSFRNIGAAAFETFSAIPERRRYQATQEGRIGAFEQSSQLAKQAQQATDPTQRQELLERSRGVAAGAGEAPEAPTSAIDVGLLSQYEARQISEKPLKAIYEQGVKPAAGVAAFAIPVGKATTIAQAAKLGAVAGGLAGFGAIPETATPGETFMRTGASAVVGGLTAGMFKKIQIMRAERATKKNVYAAYKQYLRDMNIDPKDPIWEKRFESWYQQPKGKRLATELAASTRQVGSSWRTRRGSSVQEVTRDMQEYGLVTDDQWRRSSDIVTGKFGVSTRLQKVAVKNAKPVRTDGLLLEAQAELNKYPELGAVKRNSIMGNFKSYLVDIMTPEGQVHTPGSIPTEADPSATLGAIRSLRTRGARTLSHAPLTDLPVEKEATGKAFFALSDTLEDRLFVEAGADDIIAGNVADLMTVEEAKALQGLSPKLYDEMVAAKTIGELRKISAPFVQASEIAERVADVSGSPMYQAFRTSAQGVGAGKYVPTQWARNIMSNPIFNQYVAQAIRKGSEISGRISPVSALPGTVGRGIQQVAPAVAGVGVQRLGALERARNQ